MKHIVLLLTVGLLGVLLSVAQRGSAADATAPADSSATGDASATDAEQESPLDDLDWMVGQWIDQGEDVTIATNCSWTKNGNFLTRSFRVVVDEEVTLEGTQVVGWDPIGRRIRSWTFDSEGGFGQGRWIQDGSRWLVKTSYVLASGERASALNVFTYVDPDTFRWQSVNREVGGELQPNIPEVTVVRQKAEESESQPSDKEVSR
jgi:hypothetical protein